jgi:2-polyprenyl-3-methyl-5-hydroxy-6-metoxy-1,4-benzoquinol methylase
MKAKLTEHTVEGLHQHLSMSLPAIDYDSPILDLGCGTGAWLGRLASMGYKNIHGIDRDISQFGCAESSSSQADFDRDDLGTGDTKFKLVTAIEVIEHLENPGRFLAHVRNCLASDGYFLLTTPNIHSALSRFRFMVMNHFQHFDRHGDPTHIYPIYLPAMRRILDRHGLIIARQWTYPKEHAGIGSRWYTRCAGRIFSLLLPDHLPGDVLCLLIKKIV